MTRALLFIPLFICWHLSSMSQNRTEGSIQGRIIDESGNSVAYATLMLLNMDSVLVKADYSREDGVFIFDNLLAGDYQLELRSIQYKPYISDPIRLKEGEHLTLDPIPVAETVQELSEVKVTATKPLIEVHSDKLVFNVAESPSTAGTDALEMLRKVPGVSIDNNDNIILQGKSGVKVYIDGKPTRLGGQDLANMLKAMQSDGVESVDIISNPSARYEAEGNAGIIDIKLKRDKNLGLNATINGGYSKATFSRYQGGIDFNYRDRKLNVFGNYSFQDNKFYSSENYYKTINDNIFDQTSDMIWGRNGYSYRTGADYQFNKKHLLGFVANGISSLTDSWISSVTPFGKIGSEMEQRLDAESTRIFDVENINWNLNYVYTGTEGARINVDMDYGKFSKDSDGEQSNVYRFMENGNIAEARYSADDQITNIDIRAVKFDYEKNLGSGKLSFGGKFSGTSTDNDFKYFNIVDEKRNLDLNRSNDFIFKEGIGAGYLIFNGNIDKNTSFNLGVRTELTNSSGFLESIQDNGDNLVEREYLDVFPSGGIAWQMDKKNKIALNYSRRIDRPQYEQLNPFEFQMDELTYRKGNPFLRPQYTHNIKVTHSFNNVLNAHLGYSRTNNYFAQIIDAMGGKAWVISTQNIASSQTMALNVNYSAEITNKWNIHANSNLYRNLYRSELPGNNFEQRITAVNFYGKSNFILPYDLNLEVSGWYNSPTIWGGTFKVRELWSMDIGVKRSFWDNKATVRASVSDIFRTNIWHASQDFGGVNLKGTMKFDSRQIRINFSYRIGNQQVKGSRSRSTSIEEENKRLGGE